MSFINKLICFFKGHVHHKEDTKIRGVEVGAVRLSEHETDYKNTCRRCGKTLKWTYNDFTGACYE